jgi:integrase
MVASKELGPKSANKYIKLVKMIVASSKDPKTRKQLYPVFWVSEYFDLPIVEKRNQKRPAFDSETVTRLVSSASWYVQIVYVLAAASGMRIGEVLGLETLCRKLSTVLVRQKVRKCKTENYLKTDSAFRDIDLNVSVVKMLKEFIGLRTSGFLFASRNGKPFSDSNILNRTSILRSRNWIGVTRKLAMGTAGKSRPSADSATRTCERIGFRMT